MRVVARDLDIIRLISRLRQVSTRHVDHLFFVSNASSAPLHRTLARLYANKYLHRVERRMIGGSGRGSGQFVYSLGLNGYRLLTPKGGKFTPARTVNYHTLAIADAYVAMRELEHEGELTIERWSNESRDIKIEGIEIRPDLEIVFTVDGEQRHWWIECDLGNEDSRQLREKIERICKARELSGVFVEADGSHTVVEPYPFPTVIFIVPDQERANEINYILTRLEDGQRDIFRVILSPGALGLML